MLSTTNKIEAVFSEAFTNWNLEKLYGDLACVEKKSLTSLEKTFIRGLLCGYTPAEISERVYGKRDANSVRVSLSRGIYRYIEKLLNQQTSTNIKVSGKCIPHLLKEAGYKLQTSTQFQPSNPFPYPNSTKLNLVAIDRRHNLEESIDVERISDFLNQEAIIFGNIYENLERQFDRLSDLEKKVMYWLTLERNSELLKELPNRILPLILEREFLEALESLKKRLPIEPNPTKFSPQSIIMKYVNKRLIEHILR